VNNADFGKPRISASPPHENLIGDRGAGLYCEAGKFGLWKVVILWKVWITFFEKADACGKCLNEIRRKMRYEA